MRRTKIIATLGPATDQLENIEKLFDAGVDVFRLNYSHHTHQTHEQRLKKIRAVSAQKHRTVAVIADLQGPKVRLQHFSEGSITLREGATFTIDTQLPKNAGNEKHVGVSYQQLPQDVRVGDTLLVDDGRIVLLIKKIIGHEVHCVVITGGLVSNNKGLNLQGGGLSADALTEKDKVDLAHAAKIGADFIAVSFPRNKNDMLTAKKLLEEANSPAHLIAKIERAEALKNIDEILSVSDAIMIARGDLGVEIGDAALPPVQKDLILRAKKMNRSVITATQMMESMIDHQIPTRAEVFDVANAVLDGTDAVMLSAETSIGNYPEKVVKAASKICEEAEKQRSIRVSNHRLDQKFTKIDEAIAMSAMYAANHIEASAIAAVTETGKTCQWMSTISSNIPIFAFTRHTESRRRVALYRGVYPIKFNIMDANSKLAYKLIIDILVRKEIVTKGDYVLVTKGDLVGYSGGTNSMKIIRVGVSLEDIMK